ncbi:helix-turn-helix transcriptional regulator [Thermoleptolyngbya sp. M55_K2018_002]|uniref:helix-turn-helix domain-containing protein n=1 Tax=Thermoleptolyngbya sp. M55_K2018_002 TaxID=2747808 RepID=UPI0019E2007B|nr:helix-turn-helix transcriptional regulator [Thermoleptolyngbya sp. M55_K2018_002]HIK42205.1 helix-turn-helix transcriptional regulator [Thermoleptolyngbya sp. M55_K2018_002]
MHTPDPRPRIAELRKAAGLTQLQLSQRVGVTETTIANWERGRGGLDWIVKLIRLCDALNCNLKDLIEDPATAAAPLLSLEEAQALMRPPAPTHPPAAEPVAEAAAEPGAEPRAIAPLPPTPEPDALSLSDAQRLMGSPAPEAAPEAVHQHPHSKS